VVRAGFIVAKLEMEGRMVLIRMHGAHDRSTAFTSKVRLALAPEHLGKKGAGDG